MILNKVRKHLMSVFSSVKVSVSLPGGAVLRTDWIDECKVPTLFRDSIKSRCGYCLFFHSLYSLTIYPNHAFLFCSEIMHF